VDSEKDAVLTFEWLLWVEQCNGRRDE